MSAQSSRVSQTNLTTTQAPQSTTVHLRPRTKKKGVKWDEDVVDNEDMGKRSSKSTAVGEVSSECNQFRNSDAWLCLVLVCCQYEPPSNWSDSSSSDSDSSDEGEGHDCAFSKLKLKRPLHASISHLEGQLPSE